MTFWGWFVLGACLYVLCVGAYVTALRANEESRQRRNERDREFREWLLQREEEGPEWEVIGGGVAGLYDDEEER